MNKEGMPTQEEVGFMSCLLCGVKLKHDTGACSCVEEVNGRPDKEG